MKEGSILHRLLSNGIWFAEGGPDAERTKLTASSPDIMSARGAQTHKNTFLVQERTKAPASLRAGTFKPAVSTRIIADHINPYRHVL